MPLNDAGYSIVKRRSVTGTGTPSPFENPLGNNPAVGSGPHEAAVAPSIGRLALDDQVAPRP
jgi:hypothetical protein